MEENYEIREELRKYHITYNDLLPYLTNFSHIQRICEELRKPLVENRKKEYLLAIKKIKQKRIGLYSE